MSNVDTMTAQQLFCDHSESQTLGAESSGLAKRGAIPASIGIGSDASDSDVDGLRSRPVKKRAVDRACRARVLARREPVHDGSGTSGCERQSTKASSRCTLRKADAKRDSSLSDDDKDENEDFAVFLGGELAKLYDFRTGFVKLFLRIMASDNIFKNESERHGRSHRMRVR